MADASCISLSMLEADIAVLTLDAPGEPANIASSHFIAALEQQLNRLAAREDLAGVIVCSGKPDVFFTGAASDGFESANEESKQRLFAAAQRGRELLRRFAELHCVSIAAIRGTCYGPGAELVMWCDRRVMASDRSTRLGFPVAAAGFPSWGGTVRAPRLVGLPKAIDMICDGELIDAEMALAIGLAEKMVSPDRLVEAAVDLIRSESQSGAYRRDRERWSRPAAVDEVGLTLLQGSMSGNLPEHSQDLRPAAVKAARKTMLASALLDLQEACEQESRDLAALYGVPFNGRPSEAPTRRSPDASAAGASVAPPAEQRSPAVSGDQAGVERKVLSPEEIELYVRERLAALLEVDPEEIDLESDLFDLGLDSVLVVQLRRDLEALLSRRLPAEKLRDFNTLRDVADYLIAELTAPGD